MTRAWPAMPGVPAAGHIAGGFWHPGQIDGCPKCPDPERPAHLQPCGCLRNRAGAHRKGCPDHPDRVRGR